MLETYCRVLTVQYLNGRHAPCSTCRVCSPGLQVLFPALHSICLAQDDIICYYVWSLGDAGRLQLSDLEDLGCSIDSSNALAQVDTLGLLIDSEPWGRPSTPHSLLTDTHNPSAGPGEIRPPSTYLQPQGLPHAVHLLPTTFHDQGQPGLGNDKPWSRIVIGQWQVPYLNTASCQLPTLLRSRGMLVLYVKSAKLV